LGSAAGEISLGQAEALALQHYGLRAKARRLIGERDQNFGLLADDGAQLLLKLIHPAEDPAVTDFQTSLLLHMARTAPDLPVQRVVPTRDGAADRRVTLDDGTVRGMRMVSFMPGALQKSVPSSDRQRRNLGVALAGIQIALVDFAHDADRTDIAWDIAHTPRIRTMLPAVADAARRAMLEDAIGVFERTIAPVAARLRAQVVHNDLSGDNVVVDPDDHDRIAGVIDFGDATRTASINDVAIAATYNLLPGAEPLGGAVALIAGFHATKPLLADEIALLPELILARMVVRIGISEWRALRFPENRAYILRNVPTAWAQLAYLTEATRERARSLFLRSCGVE
jgi:hydroxylysine kinase